MLPTDDSKLFDKAVKQTFKMAKALGANITALHAMPDYARYVTERYHVPAQMAAPVKRKYKEEAAALSNEILDQVCAAAATAGIECARVSLISDSPHEATIKQAAKSGCDLITMALLGRKGLQSLLLGSEAQKALVQSKIPVLMCR